ncbi:TlpA family protein disulfide reductase [bacterium]|nr:TlpA family protein disulfide reductase [bacterium]
MTDFSLEYLDGETFTLSSARGKVVLLNVWNSSSAPCRNAVPEIKKVYEQFRAVDDVVIWGVNSGEEPEKVREFLQEHHLPWPILLDSNSETSNAYQIKHIPAFILIDKNGRWQYTRSGYSEWLAQELIWLLAAIRATK